MEQEPRQYVVFVLAGEQYAISAGDTQEIHEMVRIRPIPHSKPHVEGIYSYRGRVIPAINLRRLFGFGAEVSAGEIIVLTRNRRFYGVIVDSIIQILDVSRLTDFIELSRAAANIESRFVERVVSAGSNIITILSVDAIVNS